eukprot:scaffold3550_cov112-Isochrysis_galbana.AAC.13
MGTSKRGRDSVTEPSITTTKLNEGRPGRKSTSYRRTSRTVKRAVKASNTGAGHELNSLSWRRERKAEATAGASAGGRRATWATGELIFDGSEWLAVHPQEGAAAAVGGTAALADAVGADAARRAVAVERGHAAGAAILCKLWAEPTECSRALLRGRGRYAETGSSASATPCPAGSGTSLTSSAYEARHSSRGCGGSCGPRSAPSARASARAAACCICPEELRRTDACRCNCSTAGCAAGRSPTTIEAREPRSGWAAAGECPDNTYRGMDALRSIRRPPLPQAPSQSSVQLEAKVLRLRCRSERERQQLSTSSDVDWAGPAGARDSRTMGGQCERAIAACVVAQQAHIVHQAVQDAVAWLDAVLKRLHGKRHRMEAEFSRIPLTTKRLERLKPATQRDAHVGRGQWTAGSRTHTRTAIGTTLAVMTDDTHTHEHRI